MTNKEIINSWNQCGNKSLKNFSLDKHYSVCEFENDKLIPNKPTKGVYAFCGIANPKSFLQYLDDEKIEIKWKTIYNDHYDYSEKSMTKLKDTINQTGANSIITTEKDFNRLENKHE